MIKSQDIFIPKGAISFRITKNKEIIFQLNPEGTIGEISMSPNFFKNYKPIGSFSLDYINKVINLLKDDGNFIGNNLELFIDKKGKLTPCKIKDYAIAPILPKEE